MLKRDDSSFPAWIMSAFREQDQCGQCNSLLTIDDIIVVGLFPPTEVSGAMVGPMAGFEVRCPDCRHLTRYAFDIGVRELVGGIDSFYDVILQDRLETESVRWNVFASPNQAEGGEQS